MEKNIYKNINDREFYDILANTDELNKTILLNLYTSLIGFITLSRKEEINSSLVDLLKKYESEAYVTKNRVLTDKEIIDLELTRISKEYKKQVENNTSSITSTLNEDTDLELQQHLLVLVEYYLGQLKIFKEIPESMITQDDVSFIKKRIAYIEALLKMKNGLYYETYLNFGDELERVINLNKKMLYQKDYSDNDINNKYYKKK